MEGSTQQADTAGAKRLGIIGGGQLGMLLCQAARKLDLHTVVLTPDATAPAVHEADTALVAAYDDPRTLAEFIDQCDVITFEFEAVPDATLEQLAAAVEGRDVEVHPEIDTLRLLKDKGTQKCWLEEKGLPTLPFKLLDPDTTADSLLSGELQLPLVQKTRSGGYDGKGVQLLPTRESLESLWPVASLVEPLLKDCIEVGVVIASNGSGTLRAYPPVSMEFDPEFNAVLTVTSPAQVDADVQARCADIANDAVAALGSAGVFAVELFVTTDEEIFINEISPRVHNSGHLTIEGFKHDQFEQHARAVTGMPLAPIIPRAPAAVMLNLLYRDSMAPAMAPKPYSAELDDRARTCLHWYGKREAVRGRKMGHITALGISAAVAAERTAAGLQRLEAGDLGDLPELNRALAS